MAYVKDFTFPPEWGFTGSAKGRHDARNHPATDDDEYGDGSYVEQMKRGGRVKRAQGGDVDGKSEFKPEVGYPGDNAPRYQDEEPVQGGMERRFRSRYYDEGEQMDVAKGGRIRRALGGPAMPAGATPAAPGPSPSPMSRATISMPVGDAAQAAAGMVQAGRQMGARQAIGGLQQAVRQAGMRQQMPPAAIRAPVAQPPAPVAPTRVPGMKKGGKFASGGTAGKDPSIYAQDTGPGHEEMDMPDRVRDTEQGGRLTPEQHMRYMAARKAATSAQENMNVDRGYNGARFTRPEDATDYPAYRKGGNFIQGAVKHPGRMQRGAAREGVSTHQYMEEHKHDPDPSMRSAANLGLRMTGGDLSPRKRKG